MRDGLATLMAMALLLGACGDDGSGETLPADGGTAPRDASPPDGSTPDARTATPDGGTSPPVTLGCEGDARLPVPSNPAERGPWPVGAATVSVGRLTVEVWYPARPGSDEGVAAARYDIREALPPMERVKISDEANPAQPCRCHRDLPLDADHGPYPVVLFVHGTAGFRTQSLGTMTHWASRGFVVVAADHPGLWLYDNLARFCPDPATGERAIGADANAIFDALGAPSGELAFLEGAIDMSRVAVAGHSAGGSAVAGLTDRPGVQVAIPMASNAAVEDSPTLRSSLFLAGSSDTVVREGATRGAYDDSPAPKRFVLLERAGHLAFSDICDLENAAGQDLLETAEAAEVCGASFAGFLFDCSDALLEGPIAHGIVDYTTAAALEEVLLCRDGEDPFDGLEAAYPEVEELARE